MLANAGDKAINCAATGSVTAPSVIIWVTAVCSSLGITPTAVLNSVNILS